MKKFLILIFIGLGCFQSPSFGDDTLFPYLTQGDLYSPATVPDVVIIHDCTDIYWTIFSSNFFGFHEFWVAYSKDTHHWSRPLYTGIPVLPTDNYYIRVSEHKIDFDWFGELDAPSQKTYYRSFIDTTTTGYTIYKYTLYADADFDGLTDLAEDVLRTDRNLPDTDDDGVIDGYDQNPLAAPRNDLSIAAKLHKAIIEYELEEFYSNQLVVVEQLNNQPLEYDRYEGIVLSLSSWGCDVFVSETGYGVPILTCNVEKDGDYLTASFQFFITPANAWGYDISCQWDEDLEDFIDFRITDDWVAE